MVNSSFIIDWGVVGLLLALCTSLILIGIWIGDLNRWRKDIDKWMGRADFILSGISQYTETPTDSKDQQITAEQLSKFTIPHTVNPISAEEKEEFNGYREKAALGEVFTIEEYTDFKSLADKISKELPEDEKEEFDNLISDLLKFIFRRSIEKIEKSGPRFIRGYIIKPGSNLKKAYLKRADLEEANLSKANLRSADLTGADLSGANLKDAKLTRAKLNKASLDNSILKGADLRHCKLWHASLENANMSGADVREVEFYSANLKGAIFENADLRYTSFYHVKNLEGSKFKGAKFFESIFEGAILDGADFEGADLDGLTINSLKKSRWENAKFEEWVIKDLKKG